MTNLVYDSSPPHGKLEVVFQNMGALLSNAMKYDEKKNFKEAYLYYEKTVEVINEGLRVPVRKDKWPKAYLRKEQLVKFRNDCVGRMKDVALILKDPKEYERVKEERRNKKQMKQQKKNEEIRKLEEEKKRRMYQKQQQDAYKFYQQQAQLKKKQQLHQQKNFQLQQQKKNQQQYQQMQFQNPSQKPQDNTSQNFFKGLSKGIKSLFTSDSSNKKDNNLQKPKNTNLSKSVGSSGQGKKKTGGKKNNQRNLETPKKKVNNLYKNLVIPKKSNNGKKSGQKKGQDSDLKGVDKKMLGKILDELLEKSTNVTFNDVSGLEGAKQCLTESVILPQLRSDLFSGLRTPPKGVLLFGPPGNGKTFLAKAVASECKAKFFSISASSLVSKWHGESEKLCRALFAAARYLAPSIIFIDEIDSILSARSSNEHEASRRLKTEFLVQIDGVASGAEKSKAGKNVLVLAATNLPFDLDDALLRRFQKRIYIPLPTKKARAELIKKLLSKEKGGCPLSNSDLYAVASSTDGYSCSDLSSLCRQV